MTRFGSNTRCFHLGNTITINNEKHFNIKKRRKKERTANHETIEIKAIRIALSGNDKYS